MKSLLIVILAALLTASASHANGAPPLPLGPTPAETAAMPLGPVECPAVPFEGVVASIIGTEYVVLVDSTARWAIVVNQDRDAHDSWVVRWNATTEPWTAVHYFDDTEFPSDVCAYIARALRGAGLIPKPEAVR